MSPGVQLGSEPIFRPGEDVLGRDARVRTAFLAEASRVLAACDGEDAVLKQLVGLAVPAVADWCAIDALENNGSVRRVAVGSAPGEQSERVRQVDARTRADPAARTGPAEAMRTRRPLLFCEPPSAEAARGSPTAEYLAHLLEIGFRSGMVVPLVGARRTFGVLTLTVSLDSGRVYAEDDLVLADALVGIAALALEGVQLFRSEQDARRAAELAADRTARLQMVTAALSQAVTPDQVAEVILTQGLAAVGADQGVIYCLADEASLDLLREAGHPPRSYHKRRGIPVSLQYPTGVAVRTGEAVFLESPDVVAVRFPAVAAFAASVGSRAMAALPLSAHGHTLGVLGLGFRSPRDFSERERVLAVSLAGQCAEALERSRLFVAERETRAEAVAAQRRLLFLDEASALLAATLEPETALASLARLAIPSFADWIGAYVVRDDGRIECVASVAAPGREELAHQLKMLVLRDPESPLLRAIHRCEATLVVEIEPSGLGVLARDAAEMRVARDVSPRSAMLVPIEARGHVLGALAVLSSDPGRRYGPGDLSLVEDLGRRIGLALDNARLFHDAEAAVRARDEFLSVAAHELRTPLSALNLNLQALLRSVVLPSAGVEPKLRSAERQAQRISRLIENLLDVSRITAGRLDLQREEVNLSAVARDVVARSREELARAGCTVVLSADEPVLGMWDRMRLDQIATNLLSNAVKYGRGKPIEISTSAEDGRGRLSVHDHGIGIAPEHQARIFERFERAVSERHYGGLGLGLWIVRQIVEAHGGTIRVESDPGRGSTFIVELPTGESR